MTFFQILYKLILGPLELLFDTVFSIAYRSTGNNAGAALIFLSLVINLLVLPLYNRADKIQEEDREQSKRMKPGVDHIKKVFKGDERFMILQTYYRQNDYKPIYALKSSVSLLLQIPFFIAAYNYLSNLSLLQGAGLGPISNLGAPDNLITIQNSSFHLLPILMTVINLISCFIFTKGASLKDNIQLYGMSLIFLVLLYDSPSGLVIYWTCNNIFSLVKNIFLKLPNGKKILKFLCSVSGIVLILFILFRKPFEEHSHRVLAILIGLLLQLPLFSAKLPKIKALTILGKKNIGVVFYICCLYLTILTGLLIPSAVIHSSVSEFFEVGGNMPPLRYILISGLLATGTFLLWFVIFYKLCSSKTKILFSIASVILAVSATINFMGFGKDYGNLSPMLKYDDAISVSASAIYLNLLLLFVVSFMIVFLWKLKKELLQAVCLAGVVAIGIMSVSNISQIQSETKELLELNNREKGETPTFVFDKTGKNVVVIMIDRAISTFVPYIFNENTTVARQFKGFTYYPNAFSYGVNTNVTTPSLFGGYEYTPMELEKRSDELLKDKHNEALKVMPLVFTENGYDAYIADLPYANYKTYDMSIFDEYENIHAFNIYNVSQEANREQAAFRDELLFRNFFCYSLFRIAPCALHKDVYDLGRYNQAVDTRDSIVSNNNESFMEDMSYIPEDPYHSTGIRFNFLSGYRSLQNLSNMTAFTDTGENKYISFQNAMTHDVQMLQEPAFEPSYKVDNTEYEEKHSVRTCNQYGELRLETIKQMEHYQCNMSAFILLGNWFDYLRANNVWDNTRIVLASDHAYDIGLYHLIMEGVKESKEVKFWTDPMRYNPLFMVKDFNSDEFTTDYTFMTNADVPIEAFRNVIENPVNPFTGKPITDEMKYDEELYALITAWQTNKNNGNTFADPIIITFTGQNVFDPKSWEKNWELMK